MSPDANAEVYKGDDGQWYWRLQDSNGRIVSQGEGYTRKRDAKRGMGNALKAAADALHAEQLEAARLSG